MVWGKMYQKMSIKTLDVISIKVTKKVGEEIYKHSVGPAIRSIRREQ